MAMQALRNGASGGILKFILFGILALAAGGLVFTDVGGFFRGGVSGNDVAKIGKEKISIQNFDNRLRNILTQIGLTPQQAYQFGYTREILNGEIRRLILMKAAADSGISVDESHVIAQIQTLIAPAIQSGQSAEQALANLLRSQGMTESQLVQTIAQERALTLLSGAVQSGAAITSPQAAADLYAYENETRNISYIAFANKDFADITEPTEKDLTALYAQQKERFAIPEKRDLTLLTLKTDTLEETLSITDETLQTAYENNIAEYTSPAFRRIAQAIFQSDTAAQTAYEATQNGKSFADIAKTGDYLPAKEFQENTIIAELASPVFDAESEGIIPPVETPLGWSVVNIEEIADETVKPIDDVKDALRENIVEEMLIEEIYTLVDELDEIFASGGSLDDAKAQFDLDTQDFAAVNAYGQNAKGDTPLEQILGEDLNESLGNAFSLGEGETSMLFEIRSGEQAGKFAAIHVAGVTPKTYTPFEEVKADIKKNTITASKAQGNKTAVLTLQADNAGKSLSDIAKEIGKSAKTIKTIKRTDEPKAPFTAPAHTAIFDTPTGEIIAVPTENGYALAEITSITLPTKENAEEEKRIADQIQKETQQETFTLYLKDKQNDHPVKINQSLLERAYATPDETGY